MRVRCVGDGGRGGAYHLRGVGGVPRIKLWIPHRIEYTFRALTLPQKPGFRARRCEKVLYANMIMSPLRTALCAEPLGVWRLARGRGPPPGGGPASARADAPLFRVFWYFLPTRSTTTWTCSSAVDR